MSRPVIPQPRSMVSCPDCPEVAIWRVQGSKGEQRSCGECLSLVASRVPWDELHPLILRPIPAGGAR